MKNVIISTYPAYNVRRYSTPWVCTMTENGRYDFSKPVGTYTGAHGECGDLIVFEPVEGAVYAFGQKDYRGKNTEIRFVKWMGDHFCRCDKLGRGAK